MPQDFKAAQQLVVTNNQPDQQLHEEPWAAIAKASCEPTTCTCGALPASGQTCSLISKRAQHAGISVSVDCTCAAQLQGCSAAVEIIWRDGRHTAPPEVLTPDIEEAYEAALASSQPSQYRDPASGYTAFTEEGLQSKGICCSNKCRHCPYGHFKSTQWGRVNRITCPTLLKTHHSDSIGKQVVLLAITAGQHEAAASKLLELKRLPGSATVVVLVAVDPFSRQMWCSADCCNDKTDKDGSALSHLMDWCLQNRLQMLAIPVMTPLDAKTPAVTSVYVTGQVVRAAQDTLGHSVCVVGVAKVGQNAYLPHVPWLPGYKHIASVTAATGTWDIALHELELPCL